ncbi:MAG: prepilin-type N-terminal cleavage/methylation domain-containing protein [Planctomycetia bacterium]|nr:prepilin-type N-terminal cleavage/methylation domain-containing protein [Planctomycetia bacterium]
MGPPNDEPHGRDGDTLIRPETPRLEAKIALMPAITSQRSRFASRCQESRDTATARHGFTVIELLVVFAIVAILLGILMPALSSARHGSMSLRCQTNLRQWAQSVIMYAQDNDGSLPRRGQGAQPTTNIVRPADWFNALPPLLGLKPYSALASDGQLPKPGDRSLWMCPRATPAATEHYFAYAMNMYLSTWQNPLPDRIDKVAPTDRQVFVTEGPGAYCSVLASRQAYSPVARHDAQINIAFLDGHVARFAAQYAGCGVGDQFHGDVRWVVPNSTWSGPSE